MTASEIRYPNPVMKTPAGDLFYPDSAADAKHFADNHGARYVAEWCWVCDEYHHPTEDQVYET